MYKIFFNECVIYIDSSKDNSNLDGYVLIESKDDITVNIVEFISKEEDLYLSSENPEVLLQWIKDEFVYIEAAGGMVQNEDDELLFIYRLETWDLPKGGIEKGESPEQAAYREIKEECGISSHSLTQHIKDTYHIYKMNGRMHLKKTFWYLFELKDNSEQVEPQVEEDIELVSWFGDDEIQLALLDSYKSIQDVYQAFLFL